MGWRQCHSKSDWYYHIHYFVLSRLLLWTGIQSRSRWTYRLQGTPRAAKTKNRGATVHDTDSQSSKVSQTRHFPIYFFSPISYYNSNAIQCLLTNFWAHVNQKYTFFRIDNIEIVSITILETLNATQDFVTNMFLSFQLQCFFPIFCYNFVHSHDSKNAKSEICSFCCCYCCYELFAPCVCMCVVAFDDIPMMLICRWAFPSMPWQHWIQLR